MFDAFELKLAQERLAVNGSPLEGVGVFSRIGFRRGDLLSVLQGQRISIPGVKRRIDNSALRPADPLQISERFYIHLELPFIKVNHSCDPNTAVVGETDLVAIRSIDQGEELTFDYSLTEWTYEKFGRHGKWSMNCHCRSPSCRGVISQFPYMPLNVKKDYFRKGVLPNFIMRKIISTGLAYDGK